MNRRLFFQWLTGSAAVAGFPAIKTAEILRMGPNDRLVISCADPICADTAERLRAEFERFIPGVPMIILGDGMALSKLTFPDA